MASQIFLFVSVVLTEFFEPHIVALLTWLIAKLCLELLL